MTSKNLPPTEHRPFSNEPRPEYLGGLSPEQKLKMTGLRGSFGKGETAEDTKRELYEKAVEAVTRPDFEWAGEDSTTFLLRKLREAATTFPRDKSPKADDEQAAEMTKQLIGQLRGRIGEEISSQFGPYQAETVAISIDVEPNQQEAMQETALLTDLPLEDISKHFGGARKDMLMAGLRLAELAQDEEFIQQVAETSGLKTKTGETDLERATTIISAMSRVGTDYNAHVSRFGQPNPNTLYREAVKAAITGGTVGEPLTKPENKAVDFVLQRIDALTGKGGKDHTMKTIDNIGAILDEPDTQSAVIREIMNRRFTQPEQVTAISAQDLKEVDELVKEKRNKIFRDLDHQESRQYFSVVPPDAVISKDGKVKLIMEMKSYTKEEFDEWLKWLEQSELDEPKDKFVITNGLQVTHISYNEKNLDKKEYSYGPNIRGERDFVRLKDGGDIKVPVLLRFPYDISDEQIQRLAVIAASRGITNIIYQRIPATKNGIHSAARQMAENALNDIRERKISIPPKQFAALKTLTRDKTWGLE